MMCLREQVRTTERHNLIQVIVYVYFCCSNLCRRGRVAWILVRLALTAMFHEPPHVSGLRMHVARHVHDQ